MNDAVDRNDPVRHQGLLVGPLPSSKGGRNGHRAMAQLVSELAYPRLSLTTVDSALAETTEEMGRWTLRKVAKVLRLAARLRRAARQAEFAIIEVGGLNTASLAREALILAAVGRRPTFFHLHSRELPAHLAEAPKPLTTFLRRRFGAGTLLALDESLVDDGLREIFPVRHILANAVVDPGIRATPGQATSVVFVGGLFAHKGVGLLLEAAHRLQEREIAATFDIVGPDGPDGQSAEFWQARAVELGVGSMVTFHGVVEPEERDRILSRAGVFCMPPLANEVSADGDMRRGSDAQPLVIMEAMAIGLPVVSSALASIPAMVRDGIDGRIVTPGSVDELADALAWYLSSPERRDEAGQAGRARFVACYSVDTFVARLDSIVVESLASSSTRRRP